MKKDKAKVLNEEMSDAQIRGFLDAHPPRHANADYHCLVHAYRGLTAPDFKRFLAVFREAGRDLNARNQYGQTLADVLATHASSGAYLEDLRAAGGRPSGRIA